MLKTIAGSWDMLRMVSYLGETLEHARRRFILSSTWLSRSKMDKVGKGINEGRTSEYGNKEWGHLKKNFIIWNNLISLR